jgi:ATP-dependent DNA ligase
MSLKEVKGELNKTKDTTKIKLSDSEMKDLVDKYRTSEKITYQKLKTQMSKKASPFPQPIRTQPTMEVFTTKENDYTIAQRITKLTAKDVRKWGDKVIADVKFDGIRAMIVIDPKKKEVRVLSRSLRTLKKFEKKYNKQILDSFSGIVKDKTVIDAELYAVGPKGEILPGPTVTGWAKNPNQDKYDDIMPSIEAFDIVVLNSKDIRALPLKYRKRLLEISLADKDAVLEFADTRMMNNNSRLIDWLFNSKVNKRGFEGLVLKDPESRYFYNKPKDNAWRKVKAVDTLDLRLDAVAAYPHEDGKPFKYYKHWELGVADSDIKIKADKGIKDANMDEEFYVEFTKEVLKLCQQRKESQQRGNQRKGNQLNESQRSVSVDPQYVKIYGTDRVPKRVVLESGPIIELFVESMSDQLKPSGQKIVRVRTDKKKPDKLEDLVKLRDYLRGINK